MSFTVTFLASIHTDTAYYTHTHTHTHTHTLLLILMNKYLFAKFDVHVTVHHVKFLIIKPTRCTNF